MVTPRGSVAKCLKPVSAIASDAHSQDAVQESASSSQQHKLELHLVPSFSCIAISSLEFVRYRSLIERQDIEFRGLRLRANQNSICKQEHGYVCVQVEQILVDGYCMYFEDAHISLVNVLLEAQPDCESLASPDLAECTFWQTTLGALP